MPELCLVLLTQIQEALWLPLASWFWRYSWWPLMDYRHMHPGRALPPQGDQSTYWGNAGLCAVGLLGVCRLICFFLNPNRKRGNAGSLLKESAFTRETSCDL